MSYLFVYGSLLPRVATPLGALERARLSAEADYLGDAQTQGQLLSLGDYPGLIEGKGCVHGGVYRLRTPDETLSWLDGYEGLTGSGLDDYRREPRTVTLADGSLLTADVYLFVGPRKDYAAVASGRWS